MSISCTGDLSTGILFISPVPCINFPPGMPGIYPVHRGSGVEHRALFKFTFRRNRLTLRLKFQKRETGFWQRGVYAQGMEALPRSAPAGAGAKFPIHGTELTGIMVFPQAREEFKPRARPCRGRADEYDGKPTHRFNMTPRFI